MENNVVVVTSAKPAAFVSSGTLCLVFSGCWEGPWGVLCSIAHTVWYVLVALIRAATRVLLHGCHTGNCKT
jgi:hypothetical protein